MRTKTLLIAAAALAAAVTSSQAQTVYSQNVVGYVNTTLPSGLYTLINNPLNGTTNGAENILSGITGGETILLWNGHGYYAYSYAGAGVGTGLGFQSDWEDGAAAPPSAPTVPGDQTDTSDGVYWAPQPVIAPGAGFFLLNPNGNETNTFTGTVVTTNNVSLASGLYSLVASAIPVAGSAESNNVINLTASFQGGETVLAWNGHGYYAYSYAGAGVGTGLGFQSDWEDGAAAPPSHPTVPGDQTDTSDGVYWAPDLQLTVGQGFFVLNPNSTEHWSQTITNIP
jgi:hypothetical protein